MGGDRLGLRPYRIPAIRIPAIQIPAIRIPAIRIPAVSDRADRTGRQHVHLDAVAPPIRQVLMSG
jgi:hypothetical protein